MMYACARKCFPTKIVFTGGSEVTEFLTYLRLLYVFYLFYEIIQVYEDRRGINYVKDAPERLS